jgi:hypothetical protein
MSKRKKAFYVSLNRLELDLLAEASYEEVTLYITVLKRLANFNTGIIGTFHKEPLTYEALANKLSRPSSQGKPAQSISRDRARDLVARLETRGLVSNVQVLGKSLVMLLPLSPIDYESGEVATATAKAGNTSKRKRVQTELDEGAGNPVLVGVRSLSEDDVSVLNNTGNTEQSNNPLSTPPVNTGQLDAAEDSIDWDSITDDDRWSSQDAEGKISEFFADDNTEGAAAPSIVRLDDIHPCSLEKRQAEDPLTLTEIEKRLGSSGILYHNSTISRGLYERWLKAGITREQLVDALDSVVADMTVKQSPHSVDEMLTARLRGRSGGTGRGRVAI